MALLSVPDALATVLAQLAAVFTRLATIFADFTAVAGQLLLGHDIQLDQDLTLALDGWGIHAAGSSGVLLLHRTQAGVVESLTASIAAIVGSIAAIVA